MDAGEDEPGQSLCRSGNGSTSYEVHKWPGRDPILADDSNRAKAQTMQFSRLRSLLPNTNFVQRQDSRTPPRHVTRGIIASDGDMLQPATPTPAPSVSLTATQPLTATQRQEQLWARTCATAYAVLPSTAEAPMGQPLKALGIIGSMLWSKTFRQETVFKPFDVSSDLRPDRQKLFHTFGTAAKATYIPEQNHPYDGIFRTGSPCYVRLSLASSEDNYVPGVSVKFLVDGKPSVNIVALPSLDSQTSHDFFARECTTYFPPATGPARVLETVLGWLSRGRGINPRKICLQPLADTTRSGGTVIAGRAPDRLILRNPGHHLDPTGQQDFRQALADRFEKGDSLCELWSDEVKLGTLQLDSKFVPSTFGDREVSFQHNS